MKNRDRNTNFFHKTAIERRQWNKMENLTDVDGNNYESNVELLS